MDNKRHAGESEVDNRHPSRDLEPSRNEDKHPPESPAVAVRIPRAAQMLDRSISAVYADVAKGDIPAFKIGSSLRIPLAAIQRLIDQAMGNA
jgi:hypothetical protein